MSSKIKKLFENLVFHRPNEGANGIWRDNVGNVVHIVKGQLNKEISFPIQLSNGTKIAPLKGSQNSGLKMHYENGPAVILPNNRKVYLLNDSVVNKTEYEKFIIAKALSEL
jgi:hypothetical protein